jgi:transmembrane amino acid transporter
MKPTMVLRPENSPSLGRNVDEEKVDPDLAVKTLAWFNLGLLMLAETISLGVLSLPWAIAQLGILLGAFITVSLGLFAIYTGLLIGKFLVFCPDVRDFATLGRALWGRWGYTIHAIIFTVVCILIMAGHILAFQKMMITLTASKTVCTIYWLVLGTALQFLFSMPKSMKHQSWFAAASSIAIFVSLIIVMVITGIRYSGDVATSALGTHNEATTTSKLTGVMNIVLSYCKSTFLTPQRL